MSAETVLAQAFLEAYPERAAMTLEQMPVADAAAVLHAAPIDAAALVLRDLNVPTASDCLRRLVAAHSVAHAARIVSELSLDEASPILRAMPAAPCDALLVALPEDRREPLARVLSFEAGTAGAVMDPRIFRLPDDILVVDARLRLTQAAHELLYYLYVVDRSQQLVGVLDIPELMLAGPREMVGSVMHRAVDRLNVFTPLALVRGHSGWQAYHALPVVDDDDRLLGAVRYQTLRRLERDAADRGPAPAQLTAGALAELFQLGTSGLVAGIAATGGTNPGPEPDRPFDKPAEATRDA